MFHNVGSVTDRVTLADGLCNSNMKKIWYLIVYSKEDMSTWRYFVSDLAHAEGLSFTKDKEKAWSSLDARQVRLTLETLKDRHKNNHVFLPMYDTIK